MYSDGLDVEYLKSFRSTLIVLGILALMVLSAACSDTKRQAGGSASGGSDGGSGDAEDGVTDFAADTLFGMRLVSNYWTQTDTFTTEKLCEINSTTPQGTLATCSVSIPENRLYFSQLTFTVTAKESLNCSTVHFRPFWYQMSASSAYQANWMDAPADCLTTQPIPIDCYSGVAVSIVPSFPKFDSIVVRAEGDLEYEYPKADSGFERSRLSNRWAANNLVARAANYDFGTDEYLANSMRDYRFECRDKWHELVYGIVLTISDDDLSTGNPAPGGANDQISDWDGL